MATSWSSAAGKTIRDGMGQASKWKQSDGGLDMVITNAVIIDPVLGVVKGDIGVPRRRDRRHRQGRQPGHHEHHAGADRLPQYRHPLGGRMICTPGLRRHPPALRFRAAALRVSERRASHGDRRRLGAEDSGHRMPRRLQHPAHAGGDGGHPAQLRQLRQGQRGDARLAGGADPRRRHGAEDSRGLVVLAGRHRDHHGARRRVRLPGADSRRHAERGPATTRTPSPPSTAASCTSTTARARAGAMRPT